MAAKSPTSPRDRDGAPKIPLQPPAATVTGAASCVPNLASADSADPDLRRKLLHSTIGPQPASAARGRRRDESDA